MALLDEILAAGGGNVDSDALDSFLRRATLLQHAQGNADDQAAAAPQVVPLQYNAPAPSPGLSPMPTENVPPRPDVGVPYAAPQAQPAPQAAQGPMPAAAPAGNVPTEPTPLERIGAILAGGGDKHQGLIARIGGMIGAGTGLDRSAQTENLTVKALMAKGGFDQPTAVAIVRNPELSKAVLPALFGPKQASFAQVGEGKHGEKIYGFADPTTRTVTPVNLGAQAAASATNDLTGDEFLKTLDTADQNTVKGIIAGRVPPPSPNSRSPMAQKILGWVAQTDPTFDLTQWNSRNKARAAFNSGGQSSPGFMINSGNTAIGHLADLSDAVEGLGNFGGWPLVNYAINAGKNAYQKSSGTATGVKSFDTIRNKYAAEVEKLYKGGVLSEADLSRAIGELDNASSPQELQTVIEGQVVIMRSKVQALQDQWSTAMGPGAGDFPILHEHSQDAITRIGKNFAKATGQKTPEAKPDTAQAGGGVQEGATATNPKTGEKIVFRGGKWQPM